MSLLVRSCWLRTRGGMKLSCRWGLCLWLSVANKQTTAWRYTGAYAGGDPDSYGEKMLCDHYLAWRKR